jgi:hypothetical protein
MRLAALSTGAGAPAGDFAGTTAAIYSRVCILLLADESLLTLIVPTIGNLPKSIMIDARPKFAFADVLAVGANVAARSGILRIAGSALSIDLRSATRWRSCLSHLRLDGSREAVVQALEAASTTLQRDGRSHAFARIAGAGLADLEKATRTLNATAAGEALSGLVGLGEGTTPAGDDYLVGYFAGLWICAGRTAARLAFIAAVGDSLRLTARRAGRVSRVYLEAAADGEVSERLSDLASCIAAGSDRNSVESAAAAAIAVGHSSGACGVLGFLQACAFWSSAGPVKGRDRR